jgi:uncharacterized membrane protein YoaK (UPF0700 family)
MKKIRFNRNRDLWVFEGIIIGSILGLLLTLWYWGFALVFIVFLIMVRGLKFLLDDIE